MKLYTLKVKHIILHLSTLITLIFVPVSFGDVCPLLVIGH